MSATTPPDASQDTPVPITNTTGAPFRNPQCPVCAESIKETDDTLTHTSNTSSPTQGEAPCLASFHKECLEPWMEHSPTCPLCRGVLKDSPPVLDSDDDESYEFFSWTPPASDYGDDERELPIDIFIDHPVEDLAFRGTFPLIIHLLDNVNAIADSLDWDTNAISNNRDLDALDSPPGASSVSHLLKHDTEYSGERHLISGDALTSRLNSMSLTLQSLSVLWFWRRIVGLQYFQRHNLEFAPRDIFFVPARQNIYFTANYAELESNLGSVRYRNMIDNGTQNLQIPMSRSIIRRILHGMDMMSGKLWRSYRDFCRRIEHRHSRYWILFTTPTPYDLEQEFHFLPCPDAQVDTSEGFPRLRPGVELPAPQPPSGPLQHAERQCMQEMSDLIQADQASNISSLYHPGVEVPQQAAKTKSKGRLT